MHQESSNESFVNLFRLKQLFIPHMKRNDFSVAAEGIRGNGIGFQLLELIENYS